MRDSWESVPLFHYPAFSLGSGYAHSEASSSQQRFRMQRLEDSILIKRDAVARISGIGIIAIIININKLGCGNNKC